MSYGDVERALALMEGIAAQVREAVAGMQSGFVRESLGDLLEVIEAEAEALRQISAVAVARP